MTRIGPSRQAVHNAVPLNHFLRLEVILRKPSVHVVEHEGAARLERSRDVPNDLQVVCLFLEVPEAREETEHEIEGTAAERFPHVAAQEVEVLGLRTLRLSNALG